MAHVSCAAAAATTLLAAAACASHRIPAASGTLDEPRAAWMIKAGESGREREVCGSDRDVRCVLPASTPGKPVSVVVSVFLFPAGEIETRYQGAYLAAFIPGRTGRGYERKVDYTIGAGRRPGGVTVASHVVSEPGDYPLDLALFATVPGHADPHQFVLTVPVRVVSPGAAAPIALTSTVSPKPDPALPSSRS